MRFHLRILHVTVICVGLVTLALAALLTVNSQSQRELNIGGWVDSQIALSKDLVADILPPPAYVIEAYLEATLALQDPAGLKRIAQG